MPQSPEPTPVEVSLAQFLRLEQPYTYCDACLAFTLHLEVDAVRAAAIRLATASVVIARSDAECDQCDRFGVVTHAL